MNAMINTVATPIRSFARTLGFDVIRHDRNGIQPQCDISEANLKIFRSVQPYTMTSIERVNALIEAVRYVVKYGIEGDFAECGVWKGGSSMAMARTLQQISADTRHLHLYDTFSGMSSPTDEDVSVTGVPAEVKFSQTKTSEDSSDWCASSIKEVKANLFSTGYPENQLHFIQGKVEETIPGHLPDKLAILRLDTDWYESTKHEMVHLFPRLQNQGVLIVDDYGHWEGVRKAVDEYIAENNIRILLNRIDYTGRIGIKTS